MPAVFLKDFKFVELGFSKRELQALYDLCNAHVSEDDKILWPIVQEMRQQLEALQNDQ